MGAGLGAQACLLQFGLRMTRVDANGEYVNDLGEEFALATILVIVMRQVKYQDAEQFSAMQDGQVVMAVRLDAGETDFVAAVDALGKLDLARGGGTAAQALAVSDVCAERQQLR